MIFVAFFRYSNMLGFMCFVICFGVVTGLVVLTHAFSQVALCTAQIAELLVNVFSFNSILSSLSSCLMSLL